MRAALDSPLPSAASPRSSAFAGAVLVAATALAYARSFSVPFIFDDIPSILENPSIRHLWPPWSALTPPPELNGYPVGGRPLVNLSLALNYAVSGAAPAGYHAFNLLLHVLATLTLFGAVRRTLLVAPAAAHLRAVALPLAFTATALWALHPLHTAAVTYVCQRAELLMALAYLLTLYAFIRSVSSPFAHRWLAVSAIVCLLGMAAKEVMVSAPLMVFLYDRTFVAGDFSNTWRQRRPFYLALASTWLLLALLVIGNQQRGGTAGFDAGVTPWAYALTQVYAIPHYLAHAVWPSALVFDYGIAIVPPSTALIVPALVLAILVALTCFALLRRPALGFLGTVFFAILAPTSSVVPVATQTIAEHRMYLALAPLAILAVLGLHRFAGRHALLVGTALAAALGLATTLRHTVYQSELTLWTDTVAHRPENSRAHNNLGIQLFQAGRAAEALSAFDTALRLRPAYPEAHNNLGSALLRLGRPTEAAASFVRALGYQGDYAEAHCNLGLARQQLGQNADALASFSEALRLRPRYAEAHNNLGILLLTSDRTAESVAHFETVLRLKPLYAEAHNSLGVALMRLGRFTDAISHYESALRLNPAYSTARENLTALRARLGSPPATPIVPSP